MTELKRCPFCGGEATIRDYNGLYVECCDCHVRTPPFMRKHQNNAIAVWNARPNPWHTGTPTEEGAYLIKLEAQDREVAYTIMPMEAVICGNKLYMKNYELSIIEWQKIDEGEETNDRT